MPRLLPLNYLKCIDCSFNDISDIDNIYTPSMEIIILGNSAFS